MQNGHGATRNRACNSRPPAASGCCLAAWPGQTQRYRATPTSLQAAAAQTRVLTEPAPAVVLLAFGADGLEFRLGYWMGDPENGSDNLRSLVNLEILRLLRAHQIEIPFPQRVIHQRPA